MATSPPVYMGERESRSAADKDMSGASSREKNDQAAPWVGRAGSTFPLSVDWNESV